MPEFRPPKNESDFHENFKQIKPLMNKTEAYYESSRCLFCYDAPCIKACPTHIDIPLFIRQINSGNLTGSARTIFSSNNFGRSCGYVCPTEVLCEGACVYNDQLIKPIEIGRLQAFATDQAIKSNETFFSIASNNSKKVAIIGAGPAGISCACELRKMGFQVDIFEAKNYPSGLTLYGVAPYKISNKDVLEEMNYLEKKFAYKIHYNKPVLTKSELQDIESGYDAVFLGIGLGETGALNIPGEDLDNCIGAVEFIEKLKIEKHKIKVGKKVIILGGGNTAMDAASECSRMGAEKVILCYRRSINEMRAYWFEYDLAKSVGTSAVFNITPVEIMGSGKVQGVRFARSKTTNGKIEIISGSEFEESCDMVIKGTGQAKNRMFLGMIDNLKIDNTGRILVDKKSGQTSNPKYFAGGDAANGGKEVVNAVEEGKIAAKGINQYVFD